MFVQVIEAHISIESTFGPYFVGGPSYCHPKVDLRCCATRR